MAQFLQRALIGMRNGSRAAEDEDRAPGLVRVGDAGNAVGHAGASGQQRDAGLARDLGPALGGMHRDLLVACIHHADALTHAAIVDRRDVAATQRKDDLHARLLEHLRDNQSAVENDLIHRLFPLAAARTNPYAASIPRPTARLIFPVP